MSKLLIIGCGHRQKSIFESGPPIDKIVTLDFNQGVKPDVLHDLEVLPYPFADNEFDAIEAIEVLEHLGQQGDFRSFFAQFSELWRILKPNGLLRATVPHGPRWTWGDPGHRRVINGGTLIFLSQAQYQQQQGRTPMSDYRFCYRADFKTIQAQISGESFIFILQAIKGNQL